jgi:hypothetical protein
MKIAVAITCIVCAALAIAADLVPATSLTNPVAPQSIPDADGFIRRWLLLEPIPAPGLSDSVVQAAVNMEYFPNQLTIIPRDGEKVRVGSPELPWHAVDTRNYNVNLFHARAYGKPTSDVLFWGLTIVNFPREMSGVRLAIGSNAASVWWVNGKELIAIYGEFPAIVREIN